MPEIPTITVEQLAELSKQGTIELIDVREPEEFEEVHAAPARNVPIIGLDLRAVMQGRTGAAEEPLYLICRSGMRSLIACEKFVDAGFSNVINVEGGTLAWEEAGLPVY